jgi:hypothetical protein
MSTDQLYYTWLQCTRQLHPSERITRLRNFAWLLTGIYQSRSVHLSKIAEKIPGAAKLVSLTRRLSRFLDNPAIRVRQWYEPVARGLLDHVAQTSGEIRLIADGTKVSFGHQLLWPGAAEQCRWPGPGARVPKGTVPPANSWLSWLTCTDCFLWAVRFCSLATVNLAL